MSVDPGAILAVFRLLGRWFPPPPLPPGITYEQLHAKWKRFDRVTDVLFLPVAIALMFLLYFFFRAIDDAHTRSLTTAYGPLRYFLNVSHVELAIGAIMIGFFATLPRVSRCLLRFRLQTSVRRAVPAGLRFFGDKSFFFPFPACVTLPWWRP